MRGQVVGMALYSMRGRTGRLGSDETRAGRTGQAGSDGGVRLAENGVGLEGNKVNRWEWGRTGGDRIGSGGTGSDWREMGLNWKEMGSDWMGNGVGCGGTRLDWRRNGVGLEGERGRTSGNEVGLEGTTSDGGSDEGQIAKSL